MGRRYCLLRDPMRVARDGIREGGSGHTPSVEEIMADDGGAVAERRKPEAIAREIEQTRAELADTIDAIAGRMSPKRAVARGTQRVRSKVSSPASTAPSGTTAATEAAAATISLDAPAPAVVDVTDPGTGVDPKLLVAGAAAGAAVGLLALRRKR
jgi:hypothetical protein